MQHNNRLRYSANFDLITGNEIIDVHITPSTPSLADTSANIVIYWANIRLSLKKKSQVVLSTLDII